MPKKTGGDLGLTSVIPTLALVSATKLVRDNKNLFKGGECTDTNYQPGGNMYLTHSCTDGGKRSKPKGKGKRTVKGGAEDGFPTTVEPVVPAPAVVPEPVSGGKRSKPKGKGKRTVKGGEGETVVPEGTPAVESVAPAVVPETPAAPSETPVEATESPTGGKHIKPKGKRTVKGGNAMDINSLREQIGLYLNGGNRNLMMYGYENGNTDTIEGGKKVTPKKPRKAMKGGNESLNSEVQEIEEQNTMDDKSAMDNKGLEMQGGKKTKTKSKRGRKVMKGGNESEANHEALDSKALDSELIGTIKGGKNNTLDRLRSQIAGFLQKMNDKK